MVNIKYKLSSERICPICNKENKITIDIGEWYPFSCDSCKSWFVYDINEDDFRIIHKLKWNKKQ